MAETEKPHSLVGVLLEAAKKAAEKLAKRAKKPSSRQPPEKVFVAEASVSQQVKKKKEEDPSSSKPKEGNIMPVMSSEKLEALKGAVVHDSAPNVVVQKAAEASPQFAAALGGKPVKDVALQEILVEGVTQGKTLEAIAQNVKKAVLDRRIRTSEGSLFAARVAYITKNPDLVVQASGSAGWELYDASTDLTTPVGTDPIKTENLKTTLKNLQAQLDLRTLSPEDELKKLDRFADDLASGTEQKVDQKTGKNIDALYDVSDVRAFVQKIELRRQQLADQIRADRQADYIAQRNAEHSQFSLSPQEEDEVFRNPEKGLEYWIRRSYVDRSFSSDDAANTRIALIKQVLSSGKFRAGYLKYHPGIPVDQEFQTLLRVQEHALEFVEKSLYIKLTSAALHVGENEYKQVVSFMRRAGTRGWEVVYMGNNGMNGIAFEMLDDELRTILHISSDPKQPHRLTPELFERAKNNAKRRLKEKANIYNALYDPQNEASGVNDPHNYFNSIDHFVNVAEVLADTRQKVALATMRGRGPGQPTAPGEAGESSYSSLSYAETIASIMDWERYGPDKWDYLSPGAQREAEFIYEYSGIIAGYDKTVDDNIAKLRRNGTYKQERDAKLRERWGKDEHDASYTKWRETYHNDMILSADKEYRRLCIAELGKQRFGEILEMYDIDSNIWRAEFVLKMNNFLYEDAQNHALGFSLRYAGNDFLSADPGEEADAVFENGLNGLHADVREKILKRIRDKVGLPVSETTTLTPDWGEGFSTYNVLNKIGEYAPHRTGLMLYEQNDQAFSTWWNADTTQNLARALTGTAGQVSYVEAYKIVMDKYHSILTLSDIEGLGAVDYSQGFIGMTPEQKTAMAKVFGCDVAVVEQGASGAYVTFLKHLSGQVTQREEIVAFKDPKYRRYLKRTQWVDDARLKYIEDLENLPENQPGSKVRQGARATSHDDAVERRYSTKSALSGIGGADLSVRAWNDLVTFGMPLPLLLRKAIEAPDEKTLFETLKAIKDAQDVYAGKEAALLTNIAVLAGYGRFGKVDNFLVDFFGFDKLPYTTESRRFQGELGNVFQHVDLHHLKAQMDKVYSRLELYPHLKHAVEKLEVYWGLKISEHSILPEKFWFMQFKNWAFIAAGLIILEGAKEGQASLTGSESSKL